MMITDRFPNIISRRFAAGEKVRWNAAYLATIRDPAVRSELAYQTMTIERVDPVTNWVAAHFAGLPVRAGAAVELGDGDCLFFENGDRSGVCACWVELAA